MTRPHSSTHAPSPPDRRPRSVSWGALVAWVGLGLLPLALVASLLANRPVARIAATLLLQITVLTTAGLVVWCGLPQRSGAERLLAAGLLAVTEVAVLGLTLGIAGRLALWPLVLGALALYLGAVVWTAWDRLRPSPLPAPTGSGLVASRARQLMSRQAAIAAGVALCVGLAGMVVWQVAGIAALRPPSSQDALSYHLPFALDFALTGNLTTAAPPAGDLAVSYYPFHDSLLYLWAFLPLGGDYFMRLGQVPFLALAGLAVGLIARRLGASRAAALLALAGFVALPAVARSSFLAENDVMVAALGLSAVVVALTPSERLSARWVLLGGCALGLLVGLKYLALLYAAPIGALLAGRTLLAGRSWRRGAALVGLGLVGLPLLIGGYAYLRNWTTLGNPLYPAELRALGLTLFPGPLSLSGTYAGRPDAVLDWSQLLWANPRDWAWLIPLVFVPGVLFALGCLLRAARRPRATSAGSPRGARSIALPATLALLGAEVALFVWGSPLHYGRFLFLALGLAAALSALGLDWLLRRAPWLGLPALALVLADAAIETPVTADQGALGHWLAVLAGAAALGALGWLGWRVAGQLGAWLRWTLTRPWRLILPAGAALLLAALALRQLTATVQAYDSGRYLTWNLTNDRHELVDTWGWLDLITAGRPATVVYAGDNTSYPLYGRHYRNRVAAVPLDGRGSFYAWGQPIRPNPPGQFRDEADWQAQLDALGAEFLVVILPRDSQTFAPEDEWAAAHPERFARCYTDRNGYSHIYVLGQNPGPDSCAPR